MNRNNPQLVRILMITSIIILVGLSILSNYRIKRLVESSGDLNHTNIVKLELENAYSALSDLESSQRGYIITHDAVFLESYSEDSVIVYLVLNKIDSLLKDNPSQRENGRRLRELIEKRRNYITHVLDESEHQRVKKNEMIIGKDLMKDVHMQIDTMKKEEDRLLAIRTQRWVKESYLNPILITAVSIISIIALVIAYFKIINDLKISDKLREELEESNRKLAEVNKELHAGRERFFKIFENNPVALSFGEIGTNRIIYANKLFYSYFGYTPEEVIGHTSDELKLISPEENARLIPIIMSMLEETRSVEDLQKLPPEETEKLLVKLREKMFRNGFEVEYTRKNGEKFYAVVFYELIDLGRRKYTLTSYQDITERKAIQLHVEKQNEELTRMNKELEEFNYISSHDLQEPLRKIQTFASRIEEIEAGHLSEKGKEIFQRIQNAAHKMQMLIDDLLSYSRMSNAEKKFENVLLSEVLDEVKEDLKEEIQQKQAAIEGAGLCEVNVIRFQMRQLLYNLISNSLKFSEEGRRPVINIICKTVAGSTIPLAGIEKDQDYFHISLSDNGIGFEQEYSGKIFELFNRLHRKSKYKGTGIGLAIVKKIIENHKGVITASGQPGIGARFDIYLPQ
jgi:nitrogen-specific signal transduction histidine kinase/CHASE3 domain sensor protein